MHGKNARIMQLLENFRFRNKYWVATLSMLSLSVYISHPKTAYSCKKGARPSKAELTATKSNDIIMWPCERCVSCKINIS